MLIAFFAVSAVFAQTPKYIFLIMGDGMGHHAIKITEDYKAYLKANPDIAKTLPFEELSLEGKRLNFREFPCLGLCETEGFGRPVTGSSEAATALFCGTKSFKGAVGVDPEGTALPSLFTLLHEQGYQVGIMSTDPVNHASPAVAYAHCKDRGDFREISRQLPLSGFEFFAGDSFIDYPDTDGKLNADQYVQKYGYKVFYGTEAFAGRSKKDSRVILCNKRNKVEKSNITAEMDLSKNYVLRSEDGTNTLAQELQCCLEYMDQSRPFVLFCEEGEVDHTSHLNFARALVHHMLRLEQTVDVALDFYRKHPDETLIVVFSDHETGAPAPCEKITGIKWDILDADWNSGRILSSYTEKECRDLSRKAGIKWSTSGHTAGFTPVFAIGAGAERLNGSFDNTEFSKRIMNINY